MDMNIVKILVVFLTLWSFLSSAPLNAPMSADSSGILKYNFETNEDGSYSFEYETADGTRRQERGQFYTDLDKTEPIYRIFGSFSYKGPDGITYSVNYRADEYGFRPIGAHIPGRRPDKHRTVGPGVLASLLG